MKILVFEYITGGGFNKQELPDSLVGEGRLMLNALLNNLNRLNGFDITVMLDWRISESVGETSTNKVIIQPEHDITEEFARLVKQSDLVWPIAPEFDGILQTLCQTVESLGKILLTSPATAVAIAGNKFKTYELLNRHRITVVPTRKLCLQDVGKGREHDCMAATAPGSLAAFPPSMEVRSGGTTPRTGEVELRLEQQSRAMQEAIAEERKLDDTYFSSFDRLRTGGEWMVKPVDGVGCADSYLITNRQDFERMAAQKNSYIIQPHLQGAKTSLSCLFKQGCGWLVSVNLQRFELVDRQYHLTDIVVNHHPDPGSYQQLITKIAGALPELWGYAGIDLIENDQMWVLEINPRLTTSFVGIYDALGINIAEVVLQLLHGEPMLNPACSKPIIVQTKQETHAS